MSSIRTLAKHNAALFTGTILNRIALLVLFSLLARTYGEVWLGDFYLLITLSGIFTIFANFGFDILTVREIASRQDAMQWFYPNIALLKVVLSLASVVMTYFYLLVENKPDSFIQAGLVSSLITLFSSNMSHVEAVLRGKERFGMVAAMQVLHGFLGLSFGLIALSSNAGLAGFMFALVLSYAVTAIVFNIVILLSERFFTFRLDLNKLRGIVTDAAPFVITSGLSILYYRLDILLLSALAGSGPVGWYGAAGRIVENYGMIPGIIVSTIFPSFSRQFKQDKAQMEATSSSAMRVLLMIGIPVSVFSLLDAGKIIVLFYGSGFSESVLPFQVLCLRAFSYFITTLLGNLLFAANQQRAYVRFTVVIVFVSIVLNVLLIPTFKQIGPALAVAGSTLVGLLFHIRYVDHLLFRVPILAYLWKPALAVLPMSAFLLWSPFHILIDMPIAGILLVGTLWWGGVLTADDRRRLRRLQPGWGGA